MADKNSAAADQAAADKAAAEMVEVRLLIEKDGVPSGSLFSVPASEVAAAVAGGWADDHPDAVAYAKATAAEGA